MFHCSAPQLAQLRHALGQKEGLLRLYAQDANEASNEGAGEGEGSQGEWIRALTAECQDLRESNIQLTAEVSVYVCMNVCVYECMNVSVYECMCV